ncbi:hypothetical protein PV10_01960 [Exophiala mesophila]|uniref:SAM domain-containing protein n=1 Tax=Exophiala mesophila TaxID=212818 RepID=A0A0D1ZJP5_EXOME|nr:uncharacterized protein PV10_01960 [Exophiala mesophila]KIV94169.1 hypothetical protein PV10_01960 [Exophiala mesophila]
MESSQQYQQLQLDSLEMAQKPSTLSFLGRRTHAPRPISEATEIFDTDSEQDPLDLPEDADSESTLSSRDDVPTPPHTGGLGGFEFHFDEKCVIGPQGPHLFQQTPEILAQSDEQLFMGMSPLTDAKSVQQPSHLTNLTHAVAELDEAQVRDWTPRQVAEWMAESGFEPSLVDKFLIHDISGTVLIDLQFEDLKELDISSFGKRHRVMSSIQQLRNSSMISPEHSPISRTSSRNARSPRSLQRPARADECQVVVRSCSHSRRPSRQNDAITPAESISIVGIEQVLPKEHKCAKGEDCSKWQKQQRRILRMRQAFEEETSRRVSTSQSDVEAAAPSIVGSSDVLGPSAVRITPEALNSLQPRDPQESVRQFLNFQHIHHNSPSPAASTSYVAKSAHIDVHLRDLPKLTIPSHASLDDSSSRTPISALQQPTQIQAHLKAQLKADPYHYGGVASPADIYRIDTPMSAVDLPLTAMMADPCQRDASQSVPPDMRFGAPAAVTPDYVSRSPSTQPHRRHHRQPSFTPSVAPVKENIDHAQRAPNRRTEVDLAHHQGWVRKRKTSRMLRHEWQKNYCTLVGNKLTMHDSDYAHAPATEDINVDDYTVHAQCLASSSKLSAAFKKSVLGQEETSLERAFAFTLTPDADKGRSLFDTKSKAHYFAVDNSRERVEWMRKLMLAKAMKKNEDISI